LRIKEQETRLTLHEHGGDDDDDDKRQPATWGQLTSSQGFGFV